MDKSLVTHTLMAVCATAAAYAAYTAPNAAERDDSVVMVAGPVDQLNRIDWDDDSNDVSVTRDAQGDVTVTVAHKSVPGAPGAPEAVTQMYPGSARAKDLFARFAPLKAARSLGEVTPDRIKGFGLDTPKSKLTLHFGAETKVVDVGSTTYGSGDFYSRGPDGVIYLLRANAVADLNHGAVSLQDRDLVGIARPKIDRIVATAGAHHREWVQRQAEDAAHAYFADPAEPDHKLEQVSNWIDRALRLRATELVQATPVGEPALTLEFFSDHVSVSTVRIWPNDKGAIAVASRFKAPVNLHKPSVDAVLHDLDAVLGEGK